LEDSQKIESVVYPSFNAFI